jgi:hypothetical protein
MPKLPKSQADIELEGQWTETSTGDCFLLCDDTNAQGHRIVIFATNVNIRQMCNSTLLLCDGTFYTCTCPGLFSQLYTVHGIVDGVVYPFVFALLPNKTELS